MRLVVITLAFTFTFPNMFTPMDLIFGEALRWLYTNPFTITKTHIFAEIVAYSSASGRETKFGYVSRSGVCLFTLTYEFAYSFAFTTLGTTDRPHCISNYWFL